MATFNYQSILAENAAQAELIVNEILSNAELIEGRVKKYVMEDEAVADLCTRVLDHITHLRFAADEFTGSIRGANSLLADPGFNSAEAISVIDAINAKRSVVAELCHEISKDIHSSRIISEDISADPVAKAVAELLIQSDNLSGPCCSIAETIATLSQNNESCILPPAPGGLPPFVPAAPPCPAGAAPEPDEDDSYIMAEPDSPILSDAEYSPAPPSPRPSANSTLSAPSSQTEDATGEKTKPIKVKPVKVDAVAFSVLSPESVKKGEYSAIDVYMYTKSQRRIIEKAIKSAAQKVNETEKGGFRVSRGSEVKIILCSDDVEVTDNADSRTWNGECSRFDFQFFVPKDYARKQIAFTCYVLFNGIQITRLHFTVKMTAAARSIPVKVKRKDCKKAFVSYSHKDENRVLSQLVAIAEAAPQLVFWLDSQSLESGDVWRKEIAQAIRRADVFLLFWSVFAKQSEEVKKEWTYALKKKGLRFIAPVPLDPPNLCPPPQELDDLHFGHPSFSRTEEMDSLKFATSKQFRKI